MILFTLGKIVGYLAMPAGLIWLAHLFGALWFWRRRQRPAAVWALTLALVFGCAGNRYFANALNASLERRLVIPVVDRLEPFDAVFVLGGGSYQDPEGRPELNSSGDRIFLAARLWHAGKARVLVASGMSRLGVAGFRDEGQESRVLWRSVGIPDQAILPVTDGCWNTRDEIRAYGRLQALHHWRRIGLVSSAAHLPRALALAAREGLEFTPLGCDWRGRHIPFTLQNLVPQADALEDTQRACWEYLGRWAGF